MEIRNSLLIVHAPAHRLRRMMEGIGKRKLRCVDNIHNVNCRAVTSGGFASMNCVGVLSGLGVGIQLLWHPFAGASAGFVDDPKHDRCQ